MSPALINAGSTAASSILLPGELPAWPDYCERLFVQILAESQTMTVLARDDAMLFYKLLWRLLAFVNERRAVLAEKLAAPEDLAHMPESWMKVRDTLLDDMDLIDRFVEENPFDLSADELAIVHSWRHLVHDSFFIVRYLKNYTVFLLSGEDPVAFGVRALARSFEDMIGPELPVLKNAVLLPFKDKIVYDGLLTGAGPKIVWGPNIRQRLNDEYREAKRLGIITSLPAGGATPGAMPSGSTSSKPKTKPRAKSAAKEAVAYALSEIVALIDGFCREHLNEDYAILCRTAAEKLARKRPSPLTKGAPNVWACGIVRTIGAVNFLNDPSQTPHMKMSAIDKAFGVGESTGQNKASAIRKMLDTYQMDPVWSLPSLLDQNPLVWMLEINGFMMDIRMAPREAQEIAFEQGLIPYIPADREAGGE